MEIIPYEGVKHDFIKISPFVRNDGIICFHDNSPSFKGVRKFIAEIKKTENMEEIGQAVSAVAFIFKCA